MPSIYREIKHILTASGMAEEEASAIALWLLEDTTGLSRVQLMTAADISADRQQLLAMAQRIAVGEPVQYVLGECEFCGRKFHVEPGVLIPRPETEELVSWALEGNPASLLDIGTGSGCIAVTLALQLPGAQVTALDISTDALRIASANAASLGAQVRFCHHDILTQPLTGTYDLIISNPPYICDSEAQQMERNVLDHEPHLALFVPDADPLLFYRAIARAALSHLTPGGTLLFEINRAYAVETVQLLTTLGYTDVELRKDQYGNERMVKGTLTTTLL